MSYLVLARKYRPGNFAEMVGQDHVVTALSNALTRQRLHHAYLFTGTRGVGKTTVARILAKSLNCLGPDGSGGITATPCGLCQACRDIDDGRFADYTELDAASNRGVDEIQTLLEQSAYKPVQGRFKVFMIDEVHMLSNTAFNAMLKTLEEPPTYLKFVLATTDPQKVPATVLSRCLQFSLRPIAPETVLAYLEQVLQKEQVRADSRALRLLARSARGSMRDALSLTDQAIAFGNGAIDESSVRQMLGTADRAVVLEVIRSLAAGDGKATLEAIDSLRQEGRSAGSTLEEMVLVLQQMAIRQVVGAPSAASDDRDDAMVGDLAACLPADETQLLYSICLHGRAELGLAPDEYAALAMILLRLLAFKPAPAAQERREPGAPGPIHANASGPVGARAPAREVIPMRVRNPAERGRDAAPTGMSQAASATPDLIAVPVVLMTHEGAERGETRRPSELGSSALPVSPEQAIEGDFWHATVEQLIARELVSAMTRELALGAQLLARDPDHWMLRVERESLNQPLSRERLRTALRELGHEVALSVEVGTVRDSPGRRNALAASERLQAAQAVILGDPFVQEMMREFGAKIVPGSIQSA